MPAIYVLHSKPLAPPVAALIPPSSPNVSTVYRYNSQNYDLVRVGVNYQFGGGAVVAKY